MKNITLPIHLNGKKIAELTWLNVCGEHTKAGNDIGLVSLKQIAAYPDDSFLAIHHNLGVNFHFSMQYGHWMQNDGAIDNILQYNGLYQSIHWVELKGLNVDDPSKVLEFLKDQVKDIEDVIKD